MKSGGLWDFKVYQEKEWFRFLALELLIVSILYITLHWLIFQKAGYEYTKLDEKQMQQINRIYFDSSNKVTSKSGDTAKQKKAQPSNTSKAGGDSSNKNKNYTDTSVSKNRSSDSCNCKNKMYCERVIEYLKNQFNNKVDSNQVASFKHYLCTASSLEATSFISNLRLQVRSYFWLTGPEVYLEIIFWTVCGVLCSLLFNLGVVGKNSTTVPTDRTTYFDSSEIPYQVAKMLYAPACTLIIILGYNFFSSQSLVDISSSKGVIVFSFIGGFYSSRVISLLDRLKDVLLPNSGTASLPINKDQVSLKNVVIDLKLTTNAAAIATLQDLTGTSVIMQSDLTKEQFKAINIGPNLSPLFIVDYVKQGTYTITVNLEKGETKLSGTGKVEMKTTDIYLPITVEVVTPAK